MSNPDYPDPCEYCPLMYFEKKSYDCRKDCEEYKEAIKQWAKQKEEEE